MICFAYASNKGPPAVKMKLSSFENVLLANKFSCHVLDFRKSLIFFSQSISLYKSDIESFEGLVLKHK
jgi:hypothetical protein